METLIEAVQMKDLFMWTFTFKETLEVPEACNRWNRFLKGSQGLTAAYPMVSGIRVYEMHPGGKDGHSHGLHVHCVVDAYLAVDVVRKIWHRYAGEGSRLQVAQIGPGRAFYIGKYLQKGGREGALAGRRIWQAFGNVETTGVRDIVVQNAWTEAYKFLCAAVRGFQKMPWPFRLKLAKDFAYGESFEAQLEKFGFKLELERELNEKAIRNEQTVGRNENGQTEVEKRETPPVGQTQSNALPVRQPDKLPMPLVYGIKAGAIKSGGSKSVPRTK